MSVYRVSYRYANSLMQLALEKGIFNKIAKDAELLFTTFSFSKELRLVLKSPLIKKSDKKNLLSKIFKKKITDETGSFLNFVVDKNREDILFEIFKEFLNLRDKKEGILRAKIISAVGLSDENKVKMKEKFEMKTNKKVLPSYVVDPNIIGGFMVEIDDTVYDASVRHQLQLLRKKFSKEINVSNN